MPKYCRTCKNQGHNKSECWIIHPELYRRFNDVGDDKDKEKGVQAQGEMVGTTVASTKVLTSGKVVGKPISITAKNEWMQRRQNKCQRDKRGYIIENGENNGVEAVKDKNKEATGDDRVEEDTNANKEIIPVEKEKQMTPKHTGRSDSNTKETGKQLPAKKVNPAPIIVGLRRRLQKRQRLIGYIKLLEQQMWISKSL